MDGDGEGIGRKCRKGKNSDEETKRSEKGMTGKSRQRRSCNREFCVIRARKEGKGKRGGGFLFSRGARNGTAAKLF